MLDKIKGSMMERKLWNEYFLLLLKTNPPSFHIETKQKEIIMKKEERMTVRTQLVVKKYNEERR